MSDNSAIEWTDATWNPVTGCTKVSPGCDHCYAERVTERFHGKGSFATVTLHPDRLGQPLRWRRPRKVFVNSMSDLFHDDVPDDFIAQVFAVMACAPQHTFQVLTKRHGRMRSLIGRKGVDDFLGESFRTEVARLLPAGYVYDERMREPGFADNQRRLVKSGRTQYQRVAFDWPLANIWLGVSVESQQWADIRIPALLETPAAVRFLSCEPLLGPVNLDPWRNPGDLPDRRTPADSRIDWVIVGGESGRGARPMHPDWARDIRDQCVAAGVPFLFKQWGGIRPKSGGRELDGRTWDEYPASWA